MKTPKKSVLTPRQQKAREIISRHLGYRPAYLDKSGKNRRMKWVATPASMANVTEEQAGVINDDLEDHGFSEKGRVTYGDFTISIRP